ncbi:MAG: hypothetical protein Q9166_006577 [cf. Caloplaca sp. 2 TL-2023]
MDANRGISTSFPTNPDSNDSNIYSSFHYSVGEASSTPADTSSTNLTDNPNSSHSPVDSSFVQRQLQIEQDNTLNFSRGLVTAPIASNSSASYQSSSPEKGQFPSTITSFPSTSPSSPYLHLGTEPESFSSTITAQSNRLQLRPSPSSKKHKAEAKADQLPELSSLTTQLPQTQSLQPQQTTDQPDQQVQVHHVRARSASASPPPEQSIRATNPDEDEKPLTTHRPARSTANLPSTIVEQQQQQPSTIGVQTHQPCGDPYPHILLEKRERSTSSSSRQSWQDPLLCSPPLKRSRTTSPPPYQPWEDPLLCSPPRTRYRTASTSSTKTSEVEVSETVNAMSDYRNANMTPPDASSSPAAPGVSAEMNLGKVPTDPAWVRESLEAYALFQDQEKAYEKYPDLDKIVNKILQRKRQSGVTADEYKEFKLTLSTYRDSNEDIIVDNVLPFLIKQHRYIPPNRAAKDLTGAQSSDEEGVSETEDEYPGAEDQPSSVAGLAESSPAELAKTADLAEGEHWVSVSFLTSGVVKISNREFYRTLLPPRFEGDPGLDQDLRKAMAKKDKMTNPKPDRAYGLSRKKFEWPEHFRIPSEVRIYLNIMNTCYHVYLIVEAKSAGGDIREARNQACRGGAALVYSARMLWALVGGKDVEGVDLRTIVFSAVMTPETVEIWVHWAEVPKQKKTSPSTAESSSKQNESSSSKQHKQELRRPKYHMNLVRSESLNNKPGMEKMRAYLHNIIDWGAGSRWDDLQPLYAKIVDYGRKKEQAKQGKGKGKEKSGKVQKGGVTK